MRKTVIFNCFLYGLTDSLNGRFCKGWGVIKQRYPNAEQYLRKKFGNKISIEDMILLESHHQLVRAVKATNLIIDEMINKDPIWLGLPDTIKCDPTKQICQDNLEASPALMSSSEGTTTINIMKHPKMSPRMAAIKKLTRKLSFRIN